MFVLAWIVLVPLSAPLLTRPRGGPVAVLGRLAAVGYLTGGAVSALLALLGRDPAGVGDTVMVLTAMHFNYAGFAASFLVARLDDVRPVPPLVAVAAIGGPLLVAAGFTVNSVLQPIGALVVGVGLAATSALTLRGGITTDARPTAQACLIVSSLAVWAGMALAIHWAAAPHLGWRALPLDTMARTHGMLNGLGFAGFGLLGRRLEVTPSRFRSRIPRLRGVGARKREHRRPLTASRD